MAFSFGNFNEVDVVGNLMATGTNILNSGLSRLQQTVNAKLNTMHTQAMTSKRWFGYSAAEFSQKYQEMYDLGHILNANYFVEFEAYEGNGTAHLPMFIDGLSGFLVSETNLPIIEAEFEPIKVGTKYLNQLTAIKEPALQMSLIETSDCRFANSLIDWRDLMINENGTLNPPASYAMIATIGVFSKDFGYQYKPFSRSFLVAPSLASMDRLNGAGVSEVLQIPLTLESLNNFMEY